MTMKKAYIIIDENETLSTEQKKLLQKKFEEIEIVKIDPKLPLNEIKEIAEDLHIKASEAEVEVEGDIFKNIYYRGETKNAVVFASTIPFLLKTLTEKSIFIDFLSNIPNKEILYRVYIFHGSELV